MNILEFIDCLMEQGFSEEVAENEASIYFENLKRLEEESNEEQDNESKI